MENAKQLLAIFEIKKLGKFRIWGEVSIHPDYGENHTEYSFPSIWSTVTQKMNPNGSWIPYVPKRHSWTPVVYHPVDMLEGCIIESILGSKDYNISYLAPELEELILSYQNDSEEIGETKIPRKIFLETYRDYDYGWACFQLMLVSDKYIYYNLYDELLLVDRHSRAIIANSIFAKKSFEITLEEIHHGEDELLWGMIAEDAVWEE